MNAKSFVSEIQEVSFINDIIKIFFICLCTYYTIVKLSNRKSYSVKTTIKIFIEIFMISTASEIINRIFSTFSGITCLIFLFTIMYNKNERRNIGYSITITIISLSVNYILFFVSIILSFIPIMMININNNFISLVFIQIIHIGLLCIILKIKKIKHGIIFLQANIKNEYFDIIVLNISIIILIAISIFITSDMILSKNLIIGIIIISINMFITIQKSIQLYYKQKLLIQELNETK